MYLHILVLPEHQPKELSPQRLWLPAWLQVWTLFPPSSHSSPQYHMEKRRSKDYSSPYQKPVTRRLNEKNHFYLYSHTEHVSKHAGWGKTGKIYKIQEAKKATAISEDLQRIQRAELCEHGHIRRSHGP